MTACCPWQPVTSHMERKRKREQREADVLLVVSRRRCSREFFFLLHGYDWQRQQRFTRACPHTCSFVIVTERRAAWRLKPEPRAVARGGDGELPAWGSWGSYLLLLFTRRGRINKVWNLALAGANFRRHLTKCVLWLALPLRANFTPARC